MTAGGMDWVLLVETLSNQGYIFGSVRLAENVGASQLIHHAGTTIADEVIRAADGRAQAVLRTSGRVLVACDSEETANDLVAAISSRWLAEVPGIGVAAAVSQGFDATPYAAVAAVHRLAAANAAPAMARFPRLPIVEGCASSPYPAATLERLGDADTPISSVAKAKRGAARRGIRRFADLLGNASGVCKDLGELDAVGLEDQWVGIVHVDGNGLGKVFLDFGLDQNGSELYRGAAYSEALQAFSQAVDTTTTDAAKAALETLRDRGLLGDGPGPARALPFVPLVLGGDDVTLVCDGRLAIPFTQAFLRAFEAKAAANETLQAHLRGTKLTACGGVAIVKAHFPFHAAYDLAEQLLSSAKQIKTRVVGETGGFAPCSALDFHVLHDSTFSTLSDIDARGATDAGTVSLRGGPYLVTDPGAPLTPFAATWCDRHRIEMLQERALHLVSAGKRVSHALRSAASRSEAEGVAALDRAKQRAGSLGEKERMGALDGLAELYQPGDQAAGHAGDRRATWLIDALDLARFGAVS